VRVVTGGRLRRPGGDDGQGAQEGPLQADQLRPELAPRRGALGRGRGRRRGAGDRPVARQGRDRQRHQRAQHDAVGDRRRDLPERQRSGVDAPDVPDQGPRPARPGHRARPARAPLPSSDRTVAPVLLGAARRLDHRATDVRRRRDLGRPLAGDDRTRLQHADDRRRGDRPLHPRLAAGARRADHPPAHARAHALVPGAFARRVPRGAEHDLRDDRPDRRVGGGDGGRASVQPRARVPARVRRRQRREPTNATSARITSSSAARAPSISSSASARAR